MGGSHRPGRKELAASYRVAAGCVSIALSLLSPLSGGLPQAALERLTMAAAAAAKLWRPKGRRAEGLMGALNKLALESFRPGKNETNDFLHCSPPPPVSLSRTATQSQLTDRLMIIIV